MNRCVTGSIVKYYLHHLFKQVIKIKTDKNRSSIILFWNIYGDIKSTWIKLEIKYEQHVEETTPKFFKKLNIHHTAAEEDDKK